MRIMRPEQLHFLQVMLINDTHVQGGQICSKSKLTVLLKGGFNAVGNDPQLSNNLGGWACPLLKFNTQSTVKFRCRGANGSKNSFKTPISSHLHSTTDTSHDKSVSAKSVP